MIHLVFDVFKRKPQNCEQGRSFRHHILGFSPHMIKVDRQFRTYFSREHCLLEALRLVGWCRFTRADRRALPPHHHGSAYEVHVLTRGRQDIVVGQRIVHLRAGQAFFTRPWEIHSGLDSILQQSEFYWAQFHSDLMLPWQMSILDALCDKRSVPVDRNTIGRFQKLLHEHLEQDGYSTHSASAQLDLLLVKLARCLEPDFSRSSPEVTMVMERLRQTLDSPPKLNSLAREAGVSPTLLSSRFKEEVGESIAKWFLHERLDIACKLLEGGYSTREISRRLGYSSAQNFATTFRRELGTSPSQFREIALTGAASFLPETASEID
jgi:AraC-like DNA-binding protein